MNFAAIWGSQHPLLTPGAFSNFSDITMRDFALQTPPGKGEK